MDSIPGYSTLKLDTVYPNSVSVSEKSSSETQSTSVPSPPRPRRRRLAIACNQCRKRKVRCDAETPQCRNCYYRNEVCQTTDPRHPQSGPCIRRWSKVSTASASPLPTEDRSNGTYEAISSISHSEAASTPGERSNPDAHLSWVTQAYRESDVAQSEGQDKPPTGASPDVITNTDEISQTIKYMGGSSLQTLVAFIDLSLTRNGLAPTSLLFRHGMQFCEQFSLPLSMSLPNLPEPIILDTYVDAFFNRIWPLFPVLDQARFRGDLKHLQQMQLSGSEGLSGALTGPLAPFVATVFIVIALGADETNSTSTGTVYLNAAYTLYGHLVAMPHLPSVQALFLLSVLLRGRGQEGQSWQILGQAIRIAHSVGLHRRLLNQEHRADKDVRYRTWWSCYALEKMMQLQTGRPSAIFDRDSDLALPNLSICSSMTDPLRYLAAFASLTRITSRINSHVYGNPEHPSPLLLEIGRLDVALEDWRKSLAEDLKPGSGVFFDDNDHVDVSTQPHILAFLSLHFYEAQITLFRASMIFPASSYKQKIKEFGPELPSVTRLLKASDICMEAARSIVKIVVELADRGARSDLLTPTQAFLAASVLALSVLKNSQARMVRSDLELLTISLEYCEELYRCLGQDPDFVRGCVLLREAIREVCTKSSESNIQSVVSAAEDSISTVSTMLPTSPGQFSDGLQRMDIFPMLHQYPSDQQLGFGYDTNFIIPPDRLSMLSNDMAFEQLWAMMKGDIVMDSDPIIE